MQQTRSFNTGIESAPVAVVAGGHFSTGIESMPDAPANRREGTFADGLRNDVAVLTRGRFSTGIESVPNAAANRRVGSFADTAVRRSGAPTPRRVVAPITSPQATRRVAHRGPGRA